MYKHNNTIVTKKEYEVLKWLQTGSNEVHEAFQMYSGRKVQKMQSSKYRSWFNKILKGLHDKGIAKNVPFIHKGLHWFNPGIEGKKSALTIDVKQDVLRESKALKHIEKL